MPDLPWYSNGLRFECTQCGNCCTGAPGFVWVNQDEIRDLAGALGETDLERFEQQYVRQVGPHKSLKEFSNGDCVFFDGKQRTCRVYANRPGQCRTWPFWDSNLQSPADWQRTCQVCPGSGNGRLYVVDEIECQRKIIKV